MQNRGPMKCEHRPSRPLCLPGKLYIRSRLRDDILRPVCCVWKQLSRNFCSMGFRRGRQKVAPFIQTRTGALPGVYLYAFFDSAFYVSLNHSSHDVGLACALWSCFPGWRAPDFGGNDARLCSWDDSLQPRSLAAQRCSLTSTS